MRPEPTFGLRAALSHPQVSTPASTLPPPVRSAAAKSLQSCLTLCDPMDCSLPDSSIHGIFQARSGYS